VKRLADTTLTAFNTFGVGAHAAEVIELETPEEYPGLAFDPARDLLLGGGSNVLLVGDIDGRACLNRLPGRSIVHEDADSAIVEAAAGENWHEFVRWTLGEGLSGLENLSLIPGSVGAAPMQNIGAYGVEIAERLVTVTTWDIQQSSFREFSGAACQFAYRDSRFKSAERDRHLICGVRLRLDRRFEPRLDYAGLWEELDGQDAPSALQVSDAVIRLRRRKLPDPARLGNAGSFFKNPVVDAESAAALCRAHPGLPQWPAPGGECKLAAGWMLEHCGWKGRREGDAGFAPNHALVLVNHGHASGAALLDFAARAARDVHKTFGIWLEPEPRIVGAAWPHPLPPSIHSGSSE